MFIFCYTTNSIAQQNNASEIANTNEKKQTLLKNRNTQFQYFIIKTDSSSFGYDIYVDGNLYIHQTTIPSINGNNGFANTDLAKKCALLVLKKLKAGEQLPTISRDELYKIGVKEK